VNGGIVNNLTKIIVGSVIQFRSLSKSNFISKVLV
jgi:hypothetical protein